MSEANKKHDMKELLFKVETEMIQSAITVESDCNEIIFINKSAPGVVIQVNGYPIAPNEFMLDAGHIFEKNVTRYVVKASAANFILFVKRKIYK